MSSKPPAASTPWLVRTRLNPEARLRLFCFPYAGGAAQLFRKWPEELPSSVEVCAVQPPGRGTRLREPPFTDLTSLVRAALPELEPYMNRPFAFFGHSMGAMISFELARELRREGKRLPVQIFVSGRAAPQWPREENHTHELPDEEFVAELRRLNGTPREVLEHPELMQLLIPVLRADFSVTHTHLYTPEPPLAASLAAFGGLGDTEAPPESIEAWREQTSASFSKMLFPGDHFFLHAAQTQMLEFISRTLQRHLQTMA